MSSFQRAGTPPPGRPGTPPPVQASSRGASTSSRAYSSSSSSSSLSLESALSTSLDAASAKLRLHTLNYLQDPNLPFLLPPHHPQSGLTHPTRSSPLINRGYYARILAIDRSLTTFLAFNAPAPSLNILEIGAGRSSLFFRHTANFPSNTHFVEIDHPDVTETKRSLIATTPYLSSQIKHPHDHTLVPLDLLSPPSTLSTTIPSLLQSHAPHINPLSPTLIIFEAVLMYLPPATRPPLFLALSTTFPTSTVTLYDTICDGRRGFGRMMLKNLRNAGLDVAGMASTPTVAAWRELLEGGGYGAKVEAVSMLTAYSKVLSGKERAWGEGREMLDEVEEWEMIMGCYVLASASNHAN